jgi:cytochrome c biogenesis DsbD-like protein
MWVETDPAQPGTDIDVHILLRIAPGHWLYGTTSTSSPFTRVHHKLKHGPEVRETGSLVQPVPDAKGHLAGTVEFRQRLHLSPDIAPGHHTLSCDLTYQACNPDLCWPPQTTQLKTEFEVSAHLKS